MRGGKKQECCREARVMVQSGTRWVCELGFMIEFLSETADGRLAAGRRVEVQTARKNPIHLTFANKKGKHAGNPKSLAVCGF